MLTEFKFCGDIFNIEHHSDLEDHTKAIYMTNAIKSINTGIISGVVIDSRGRKFSFKKVQPCSQLEKKI